MSPSASTTVVGTSASASASPTTTCTSTLASPSPTVASSPASTWTASTASGSRLPSPTTSSRPAAAVRCGTPSGTCTSSPTTRACSWLPLSRTSSRQQLVAPALPPTLDAAIGFVGSSSNSTAQMHPGLGVQPPPCADLIAARDAADGDACLFPIASPAKCSTPGRNCVKHALVSLFAAQLPSISVVFCFDVAPGNTDDYLPRRCSMFCCSDFTSMVTIAQRNSTPTWVSVEVDNSFDKRPWPPPSQAQVFSEQGMHRLRVGNLLDAESDVIWSKPPWPPPHIQIEFECGSDDIRSIQWPSSTAVVRELDTLECYGLSRKPPWPPLAHQYFRNVYAETVESWKHHMMLTELNLGEKEEHQYWGKDNWQCAVCLVPTHFGLTRDCFPDGCFSADLCYRVVLTGCVYMASDIKMPFLLLLGELIQEQKQKDHNGCSSNTNLLFTNPQDSVLFCISFTLTDSCSMSLVVSWKPPWLIQLFQQIRYRALTSAYCRGALGALLLYDVPTSQSFHNIPCWLDTQVQAIKNIVIMLVGNKSDLKEQSTVGIGDTEFAVQELFSFLTKAILQKPSKIWKWSTEFYDILAVVLAEGGMDGSMYASDEVERIFIGAKPQATLNITDIQALKRAISESHQKLADQLSEAACQPSLSFELQCLLSRDLMMDLVLQAVCSVHTIRSLQLHRPTLRSSHILCAAWGQAAIQGEGNVSTLPCGPETVGK